MIANFQRARWGLCLFRCRSLIYQHCKSCGAQVLATAKVCPHCKTVLIADEPKPLAKSSKRQGSAGGWRDVKGIPNSGNRPVGLARFNTPRCQLFVGLIVVGIIGTLLSRPNSPAPPTSDRPRVASSTSSDSSTYNQRRWYEGGTLHYVTLVEWERGSSTDQLATAADGAAALLGNSVTSMDALLPKAMQLKQCIGELSYGAQVTNASGRMKVKEAMAFCATSLGW